jgi:uncharacterized cupin superfamily protein
MGDGWFVLNAREARWYHADGRSAVTAFEGEDGELEFAQLGINVSVVEPGQFMAMYHWEADQEDFLVVSGEALLLIEEEERPLRAWDFVHCPPNTSHTIIGAGDGPCVVVSVGSRQHQDGPGWGAYPVSELARRHGGGVEQETNEPREAYAPFTRRQQVPYRDGWLPG